MKKLHKIELNYIRQEIISFYNNGEIKIRKITPFRIKLIENNKTYKSVNMFSNSTWILRNNKG